MTVLRCAIAGLLLVLLAGCGSSGSAADSPAASQADAPGTAAAGQVEFPDVVAATAEQGGDGSWTFSVTLSSPYDSPQRYADAWRVRSTRPDGPVFGTRELAHDHADEQPFTRDQSGIAIPSDVTEVVVEGRDQRSGYGGKTVTVQLSR